MRKKYYRWTDEADDMLRQMLDAGCEAVEMGRVFGVDGSQIRNRVYSLGLKFSHTSPPVDKEEFARLMELRTGRAPE